MLIIKKYIVIGMICSTVIGLVYWRYSSLLNDLEEQKLINQQLTIAVATRNKINEELHKNIKEWKKSQDEYIYLVKELREISNQSQKEVRKLNDIFSKHKLSKIAFSKPGLIEKRVNNATVNTFRMLECASGSRNSGCSSENRKTE